MSIGLSKLILDLNKIHKVLLIENKIDDLDYVFDYIKDYDYEVREQYLNILIKYYFQNNQVENFKELTSLGYKFDLKMDDIKLAFLSINDNEENVIQLYESDVVFFKDTNYSVPLRIIYDHYQNSDNNKKEILEETVSLLRKNQYISAFSYKNKELDFGKFFLDEDVISLLKKDLPFLLK